MMPKKRNQRGAILLFVMLVITLGLILAGGAYLVFYNIVSFTGKQESKIKARYLAEAGVWRAKWLLDNNYQAPPAGTPYSETLNIDGHTVSITITYNAANDYTISSTNSSKTVTAHYQNKKIVSWGM
jgi:Tfp pilus assembly protein PilX